MHASLRNDLNLAMETDRQRSFPEVLWGLQDGNQSSLSCVVRFREIGLFCH
jgi:hypothetical protein